VALGLRDKEKDCQNTQSFDPLDIWIIQPFCFYIQLDIRPYWLKEGKKEG